jgi:hypothetical protein
MRKILLTAVIAAFAAARTLHSSKVMSIANTRTIFADSDPASLYKFEYGYNMDVYYGLETDQEDIAALYIPDDAADPTDVEDLAIVDNWIQLYLASEGSINFDVNILGQHICSWNLKVVPFKLIPFWFSIYHTHLYQLIKEGNEPYLFIEGGYELHIGEINFQTAYDNFLPKVSLLGESFVPVNPMSEEVLDITERELDGWTWEKETDVKGFNYKNDAYANYNFLTKYLEDNPDSDIKDQKAYFTTFLVGEEMQYTTADKLIDALIAWFASLAP